MGLFANILEALGLKKPEQDAKIVGGTAPAAPKPLHPKPMPPKPMPPKPTASSPVDSRPNPSATIPSTPYTPISTTSVRAAISEVDVVSQLEGLAKANPQKLDWKVSIVDLLKLLDLDSSLTSRKELAVELGCPAEKIGGDYSEMNIWLHNEVLKQIAANGGNIPYGLFK